MISFPIFERIDISGYGLFPGTAEEAGLHVTFQPGLTLVLGANGLGKTTLVTIAYRLMTGPFDIPGLDSRGDLGYTRLIPTRLPPSDRKMFGERVVDNARNATASMSFSLGPNNVVINRRLSDLSLIRFEVNGQQLSLEEQGSFQTKICELVGVTSFGDWILLLRYLIFYFEDRRALVWDPSAQRQLLRMLFLPPDIAKQWSDDERIILELDSRMRNLSAALYREERALSSNEMRAETSADARVKLKTLEDQQKNDTEMHERLESEYLDVENARQYARLRVQNP